MSQMKAAGWAIWCDSAKDFYRVNDVVHLFSDEMHAKAYLGMRVQSRVECDRVVQIQIVALEHGA